MCVCHVHKEWRGVCECSSHDGFVEVYACGGCHVCIVSGEECDGFADG